VPPDRMWAMGPSSRSVTRCPASGIPALIRRSPRLTLPEAFTVRSTSSCHAFPSSAPVVPWLVVASRQPAVAGINTLLFFVDVLTVGDMKTAREWKEANTVEGNTLQLATRIRHARRSIARCWHNYPWSQPSRAIMPTALGISYAFGNGQVPV
jgi:hypothetical protein